MNSTKKNILIFLITLTVVLGVGTSLSYLRAENGSANYNNITLATFDVALTKDFDSNISVSMYPMSDTEGLQQPSQTFTIKNNGSILANYKVSLQDAEHTETTITNGVKSGMSNLPNTDVRYKLTKTYKNASNETVSEQSEEFAIANLDDTGVLNTGTIEANCTITFTLIMWQDYNSTANNAFFNKIIMVEGMQNSNLDKSGANFPELVDNMIPVYYEKQTDTTGVWKKADSKNLNASYQWFDYDNQMWANAVTVKESGTQTRDYYLNADIGTEISMDDITTMWVWIPRYKYVIFNGNNGTADEQMIDVLFEHGKETTGTVRCHDTISGDANSTALEECTDTTNGSIVNHKSTYTHPAFCFGPKKEDGSCDGEELTGFWMAKFEMSTDDATCNTTSNDTNCNKTGLNILVKPDAYSLRNINVSNIFANVRRMETYGNIHGFEQNTGATTWLDASGNLTGEINNDNNTIDTHMIKNMEWGAVAYLSQSKYGKQGNNDYEGAYKEIYINNNSDYKTGSSGGSYDSAASNVNTYLYNNLTKNNETSLGKYEAGIGPGASTTGTVYGIYDMSGGTSEYVSSNMVNLEGEFQVSNSGTWTTSIYQLPKYYNKYSYNNTNTSFAREKLGSATKETLEWYSDANDIVYYEKAFIVRGGSQSDTTSAGIFAFSNNDGSASNSISSRPVLTISRSMPWEDETNN